MLNLRSPFLLALLLFSAVNAAAQSADDRYPIVKGGKVGFIDSQGNEVIPAQFSSAGDTAHFSDGLAPVWGADGGGYIDTAGRFVIGPQKEWGAARPFREGVACVLLWGKNGAQNQPAWIDRGGKVIHVGGPEGSYFSGGMMTLAEGGKWGYVDKNFKFVIAPQFRWAEAFSEDRAVVEVGNRWGFVDRSGKVVIRAKYDLVWQFHDGLARVRYDVPRGKVMTVEGEQTDYSYKYGFVDRDGREVIRPQFSEATYFSEGYALAAPPGSDRLGIIDKAGNFVHPPEYEDGEEFQEGLAPVMVGGRWGYVDRSGAWVIQPAFSHAEVFWHGLARVAWESGAYGYVNKEGKAVWKSIPDTSEADGRQQREGNAGRQPLY
ncbi:MAG: WG repeat-containing protein [Pyrinomonadaceae bacterium]